jgi:hypothetical protein
MGLCVFFLICGPAAALMYFPLTMRNKQFCLISADVSQTSAEPTPAAAKGFDAIGWTREADEHLRNLKRAA